MKKIILTAESIKIKALFEKLDIPFEFILGKALSTVTPDIPAHEYAKLISYELAKRILENDPNSTIVGISNIITCENIIYKKPINEYEYEQLLLKIKGKPHSYITGITILDPANSDPISRTDEIRVYYEELPEIITDDPKNLKPLGYKTLHRPEGQKENITEKYLGDKDNMLGLPVVLISELISKTVDGVFLNKDSSERSQELTNIDNVHQNTSFYEKSQYSQNINDSTVNDISYGDNVLQSNEDSNQFKKERGEIFVQVKNDYENVENQTDNKKGDQESSAHSYKPTRVHNYIPSSIYENERVPDNNNADHQNKENKSLDDDYGENNEDDYNKKTLFNKKKEFSDIERERIRKRRKKGVHIEDGEDKKDHTKYSSKNDPNHKKDDKSNNEDINKRRKRKKSNSDKNSNISTIFDVFKWILAQDVIVRLVIGAIAGIIAFGLIFRWMGIIP